MSGDTLLTIVQWTATVLAAGFIARFGKMLAEYLMKRARRKNNPPGTTAFGDGGAPAERGALKNEKKRIKAGAKAGKNRGNENSPAAETVPHNVIDRRDYET